MPLRAHGSRRIAPGLLLITCAAIGGCQAAPMGASRGGPSSAVQRHTTLAGRPSAKDEMPAVVMLRPVPASDARGGTKLTSGIEPVSSRPRGVVRPAQAEPAIPGSPLPPPALAEGESRLIPIPAGDTPPPAALSMPHRIAAPDGPPLVGKVPGPVGGIVVPGPKKHGHPTSMVIPPVPREFAKQSLPSYVIEPPDLLLIQGSAAISSPILPLGNTHLVRQDGTISLGIYGDVYVAGMTLRDARVAVASALKNWLDRPFQQGSAAAMAIGPAFPYTLKLTDRQPLSLEQILQELQVDVAAFNSKFFYIILEGGGYGEQVYRVPITGNETVLDALAQVNGLPAVASSKKIIWVARATTGEQGKPMVLPVDWKGITRGGVGATNYQLFPNDRLFVKSDSRYIIGSEIDKTLSPIDRVFSSILLGASAVNQIRTNPNRNNNFNNP